MIARKVFQVLALMSTMGIVQAHAEQDATLAARLDAVLGAYADQGATYVARVVQPSTGRELYSRDVDRAVAPASNMKLTTVAAGLDRFGPDFLWRTCLAVDGDDLWIIGTGDPSCGDARLEKAHGQKRFAILNDWADALVKRGITHVRGKLLIDDGVFDDQWVGSTWPKSELSDSWSAPLTGLAFNQNCINVTAYPDHFDVLPRTSGVKLINQTRSTGAKEELDISRAKDSNVFTIKGLVTKTEELDSKAITDPGLFFADALRTVLAEKGIVIDGPAERATRECAGKKWNDLKRSDQRDGRIVAVHETKLSEVLGRIDKQSQNLFADALCKLQGRAWDLEHGKDEPGSWRGGGAAAHDFFKRTGIDDSKYVLVDGSGLSSDNRVTARLISDLLIKMMSHKYAKEFYDSLSICGKDGTLDDRLIDIPGMVHGKTGTIDGVKALSGYLTTRGGETLVFSMIFQALPDKLAHPAQQLLDDACRIMVEWPDVERAKLKPPTTHL